MAVFVTFMLQCYTGLSKKLFLGCANSLLAPWWLAQPTKNFFGVPCMCVYPPAALLEFFNFLKFLLKLTGTQWERSRIVCHRHSAIGQRNSKNLCAEMNCIWLARECSRSLAVAFIILKFPFENRAQAYYVFKLHLETTQSCEITSKICLCVCAYPIPSAKEMSFGKVHTWRVTYVYRGGVPYGVEGSVGEGRKGSECKFQNKAHRTLDPRNNSIPVEIENFWKVWWNSHMYSVN